MIGRLVARFAAGLRFPALFALLAGLFLFDLSVPDLVPFVDEVLLALGTLLVGSLRKRREPTPPGTLLAACANERRGTGRGPAAASTELCEWLAFASLATRSAGPWDPAGEESDMCLAVPMRIKSVDGFEAVCEAKGIERQVSLFMLQGEDVVPGDHVLVHVGYAIQKVSEEEARLTWELFDEIEHA